MFNSKFQLAVMSAMRKANMDLDHVAAGILDGHETCQELLGKSDASLCSAYEFIASRSAASSVATSMVASQVLALASNPHTPPRSTATITATIAPLSSRGNSVDIPVEVSDYCTADARSLTDELDSAASPDLSRAGPVSSTKPRLGALENRDGARAAPVAVTPAVHDRPAISQPSHVEPSPSVPSEAGSAFVELTRPSEPTAALLALLDSKQTAAQRSRVPRRMSALNASHAEIGERRSVLGRWAFCATGARPRAPRRCRARRDTTLHLAER